MVTSQQPAVPPAHSSTAAIPPPTAGYMPLDGPAITYQSPPQFGVTTDYASPDGTAIASPPTPIPHYIAPAPAGAIPPATLTTAYQHSPPPGTATPAQADVTPLPSLPTEDMWDSYGYPTAFMLAQFEYTMTGGSTPYNEFPAPPGTTYESSVDHKVMVLDTARNTDDMINRHAEFIKKNSSVYRGLTKWYEWTNPDHSASDIDRIVASKPAEWWTFLPRLCRCRLRASQHAQCACHNHGAGKCSIHNSDFLAKLHNPSFLQSICEAAEDGTNGSACGKQCFSQENLDKARNELHRKAKRTGRAPPTTEEALDVAACTCSRCHRFIDTERSASLVPVLHTILQDGTAYTANGQPLIPNDRAQLLAMVFAQQLRRRMRDKAREALDAGAHVIAVIQDYVDKIPDGMVQKSVADHFAEFIPDAFGGHRYTPKVPDTQLERLFMPHPMKGRQAFESINTCLELIVNRDESPLRTA